MKTNQLKKVREFIAEKCGGLLLSDILTVYPKLNCTEVKWKHLPDNYLLDIPSDPTPNFQDQSEKTQLAIAQLLGFKEGEGNEN